MQTHDKIPFWIAVLMSINIIEGAGIFFTPGGTAAVAGSISFLIWPLVALLIFPIVWGVAQTARAFPGEGGFYYYCSTGINRTAGFIAQWAYLVGYVGTAGTLVVVLRDGLISQFGLTAVAQHPYLFMGAVIAFFSVLNLFSLSLISKIQSFGTLLKAFPLLFVAGILVFYWNPTLTYSLSNVMNMGDAVPSAMFGLIGFEACCGLGHFLKGGPAQVSKVILTAFFCVVAMYTLFHLGVTQIMGPENLAMFGAPLFPKFMGLSAGLTSLTLILITFCIYFSYCNTIFGISLTNITNLYTIASRKMIPGEAQLTKLNRFDRPVIVTLIHGIVLWLLLMLVSERQILIAFTNFGVVTAFVLALVALVGHQLKHKSYVALLATIIGLGSCAAILYFSWVSMSPSIMMRALYLLPFVAIMIAGVVMYKMVHKEA
jgi:amino acid transporter